LILSDLRAALRSPYLEILVPEKGLAFRVGWGLSPRECEVLLAGGLTNWVKIKTSAR
jgi:hypothetical protein